MATSHESCKNNFHVHNITFNSDRSSFTVAMDEGVRIYQTSPLNFFQLIGARRVGSVGAAQQLDDSSVVMIAGTGKNNSSFSHHKAALYEFCSDHIGMHINVPSPILNVLINDYKIVLVLEHEVQMYDIDLHPVIRAQHCIPPYTTGKNPLGLCQLSSSEAAYHCLCFPDKKDGSVMIVPSSGRGTIVPKPHAVLDAHRTAIQCMRLSEDGTHLATASVKGTLVRVWNTRSMRKIYEFRRGCDCAMIYDIDISGDNRFLACISDKGTGHVYALGQHDLNATSTLPGFGLQESYTESVWGFGKFFIHGLTPCKIAILRDFSVIVVTKDGRYYKYQFATDGCKKACYRSAYELYTDLSNISDDTDENEQLMWKPSKCDSPEATWAEDDGQLCKIRGMDSKYKDGYCPQTGRKLEGFHANESREYSVEFKCETIN